MGKNELDEEKWILSNSVENEEVITDDDDDDEEEEEESLSLCDLPNKDENSLISKKESPGESQEEFDFWWCRGEGNSSLKESEMCSADEVFFQGRILPLRRHSISSNNNNNNGNYVGCTSNETSRSSSIRSHNSSSSSIGTSSSSTTITINSNRYYNNHNHNHNKKQIIRSQLNPRIPQPNVSNNNNCNKKSNLWSLLRVGLVATPEIALRDLKIRKKYQDLAGSRSSSNNSVKNQVSVKGDHKQRFSNSNKNMILFGTCSCSVNDVQTASPRTTTIRRSSSVKEGNKDKKCETKQAISHLRTFEWLKKLSLEGPIKYPTSKT